MSDLERSLVQVQVVPAKAQQLAPATYGRVSVS
jgi:hypothetical protein